MKSTTPALIVEAIARMEKDYGRQGWWPVRCERSAFTNPKGNLELEGYHPGQFDFPRTRRGRWEICCGAILTQNTAWTNVRRALSGLELAGLTSPERVLKTPGEQLASIIRPAGYFNQKAAYLRAVGEWFIGNDRILSKAERSRAVLEQVRPTVLQVKGIGPETADSILLYAYSLPTFVVDAYTRRIFSPLGVIDATLNYEAVRTIFEASLARATVPETVCHWQEAHALIVEHAKRQSSPSARLAREPRIVSTIILGKHGLRKI